MKRIYSALLAALVLFVGVGDATIVMTSGPKYSSGLDQVPNAFSFTDQTGVALSTVITSAYVTVSGISGGTPISVTGGEYQIESEAWTSSSDLITVGEQFRVRHTSSASNSTATNTVLTIGGVSDTFTSTTLSGASGVFFNPNVDAAASAAAIFTHDVNNHDGGTAVLVTDPNPRSGTTKSIRIRYPNDEAGTQLQPPPFAATPTLFARNYVRFDTGWAGNWPFGLKTARYFTLDTFGTGTQPNAWAYVSEKLVDGQYDLATEDSLYGMGYNNSILDEDLYGAYTSGMVFANGLPYIRENVWYKIERWYVLNSADGVADGIMQIWIDDVLVVNRTNVPYVDSADRGVANGLAGWRSMWFGGNYSGSAWGHPGTNLDRYENGFYLSTTLDR